MKFGVVVFPGSNCDTDCFYSVTDKLGHQAEFIWHENSNINKDIDVIILPGGFSYGDYLRCGAISKFSKIMPEIIKFAENGGKIIGICNGFQILTEANLLPGALLMNTSKKFICKDVYLEVTNKNTAFSNKFSENQIIQVPIAHGEGRFHIDKNGLKALEDNQQIAFRYCDLKGNISQASNPNGSVGSIAGIYNKNKNILGMMPHPERCLFKNLEGLKILDVA